MYSKILKLREKYYLREKMKDNLIYRESIVGYGTLDATSIYLTVSNDHNSHFPSAAPIHAHGISNNTHTDR